jgi:CrcB protein
VDVVLVAIGGALGAVMRFLVARSVTDWLGPDFPYGTLLINLSGSFVLGLFLTSFAEDWPQKRAYALFFAVGFLGAYTTFSTWAFESAALIQRGSPWLALVNLFGSLLFGMVAVFAGIGFGRLIGE